MNHRDAIETIEITRNLIAYVYHDDDPQEPYIEPMGVCEPYGPQRDYFPKHLETPAKSRQYHPGRGLMAEEYALTGRSTGNGGSNDTEEPDYPALARHVLRNYGSPLYVLQCDRDRYDTGHYWADLISPVSGQDGYGADRWVMGYAYITPEQAAEEFGGFAPLPKGAEHPFGRWLKAVLEERQQWAEGDVYGYVVEVSGEDVDSCWGFYGQSYAIESAREAAESYRQQAHDALLDIAYAG